MQDHPFDLEPRTMRFGKRIRLAVCWAQSVPKFKAPCLLYQRDVLPLVVPDHVDGVAVDEPEVAGHRQGQAEYPDGFEPATPGGGGSGRGASGTGPLQRSIFVPEDCTRGVAHRRRDTKAVLRNRRIRTQGV